MKPKPSFSLAGQAVLRWLVPVFLLVFPLAAQTTKTAQQEASAAMTAVMAKAQSLLTQRKYDEAATLMFAYNLSAPGSAEWHREASNWLVVLALVRGPSTDLVAADELRRRALAELAQAKTLLAAADSRTAARLEERTGYILEQLGGARSEANAAYDRAAKLDPSLKSASDGLTRLKTSGSGNSAAATADSKKD